jgi:ribose transport system ATP-binding protein
MKGAGMGYVPKDRKAEGLLLYQPLRYNSSLAIIDDMFGKLPLLDIGRERTASKKAIDELGIKAPGIETFARQLSGGNQQKVVLSRWFVKDSPILVMDNVTRGLDVGAKEDVYELCREFTRQGTSMVFIGDELPEVIGLANRIAIMYKGKIVDIVDAPADDKPTEEELISLMI